MADLEWMKGLACGYYSLGLQPWSIEADGEVWSIATNGQALVAVRGPGPFAPVHTVEAAAKSAKRLPSLIVQAGRASLPVSLDALRTWAGPWEGPCKYCKGTGENVCTECSGSGECRHCHVGPCDECNGEPTAKCDGCDGTKLGIPHSPGRFGDLWVNRGLVARFLRHVEGSATYALDWNERALFLAGPDWRVVVMGFRDSAYDGPTFTPPEAP